MRDRRLIGRWRSDRRRTTEDVNARRDLSATQRRKLAAVFGELTLRYTARLVHAEYRGDRHSHPYRVLAKDSHSVVITSPPEFPGEDEFQHIHFESSHYWVCLGAVREFFRKVKDPPPARIVKHK